MEKRNSLIKKQIGKILAFILILSYLFLLVSYDNHFLASDKVTTVGDNYASYGVDSIIEEETLYYGLKYHNDQAYTTVNNLSSVLGYVAGGSSYGSIAIEAGKKYSQNVNVLEVPCDSGINLVPYANIKNGTWNLTTVTALIKKYEQEHSNLKVIAAINGDFFDISSNNNYPKTTTGGTVSEGNYFKVSPTWKSIGFKNDGSTTSMIGNILPTVSQKPILEVFNSKNEVIYKTTVNNINSAPNANETSCYFSFYDENHDPIVQTVEDAYFVTGNEIVPFSMSSVYGKGQISAYGAGNININQFAIKTNNSELKSYLADDVTIRVQYVYEGELEGVDNVIGYASNIIVDGEDVLNSDYRHPRTMIGITEDGTMILTTVDGRQVSKGYYGVSPVEQAALMEYYGCINAYNLDGGGSTTMVILEDGEYVIKNSPSDGSPRSDGNCLLLTVEIPTIDFSFSNISTTAFDVDVQIIEMMEKYKDLYIEIVDNDKKEIKQVVNGKVTFTGYKANTNYLYNFYTKVNDEYFSLPISGKINTAKEIFELCPFTVEKILVKNDEYYQLKLSFDDENNSIESVTLSINGKKYYMNDNNIINISVEDGLCNTNMILSITYDLNNNEGKKVITKEDFIIQYQNGTILIDSIINDIDNWFNNILK